jgi:uncharacterized membrane protein
LTFYVASAVYVLALIGLYKPKNLRQRHLKVAILLLSGVFVAVTVVHTFVFVNGQINAVQGAGIGLGIGAYMAVVSSALLIFSAFTAKRETLFDNPKIKNVSTLQLQRMIHTQTGDAPA